MRNAIRKVINLGFGTAPDVHPSDANVETFASGDERRIALLATSDKLSRHWAPRWLEHAGLDLCIVNTPEEAIDMASVSRPNLLIVDAAFQDKNSCLLIDSLRHIHGDSVPLIALCASANDLHLASSADVTDIVRRPFNWQIVTQRAVRAIKAHETLAELQSASARLDHLQVATTEAERNRVKSAGLDPLTGLPNGDRFRSLSQQSISARGNSGNQTSVIAIGLDRYRIVNEAIGQHNANRVLQQFAGRLSECISERNVIGGPDNGTVTAIAARLNGARFAVQIANGDSEQIERVRTAIASKLEQPFQVDGQSIYLTASFGAAIYPLQCSDADELVHAAETAMFEARDSGAGFHLYNPRLRASSTEVVKLDGMLREAVRNNELALHYQPITDAVTSDVVAAEALLRWHHPTEGNISPAEFVPLAEKTGLMREIGDLVIETACAQLRSWIDNGMTPIRIAVNLSLCQLIRGDVVSFTTDMLAKYEIDPSLLEIELSERGVLNQRPEVVNEVHRLKDIGVRISVDDFGTGQSAIAYLKDLPIDVIKIDRSYVSGSSRTRRDEAIASGMVALAQRLDATVIAEGVETTDQLEMLRSWGSQECQGFLFSGALPGAEFLRQFGGLPQV